jgi:hypothetical protein
MSAIDYLSLGILVAIWGAQLKRRPFLVRYAKAVFFISCLALLVFLVLLVHEQFVAISQSEPPIKYFIPPYAPLESFLFSMWSRLLSRYFFALAGALLFLIILRFIPERSKKVWFEPDEPYLVATVITLVGHPHWLLYGVLTLFCYLVYVGARALKKGRHERASFYYFWIPVGVLFILLSPFLKSLPELARFTTGA